MIEPGINDGMLFILTEKDRPQNDAKAKQFLSQLNNFEEHPYNNEQKRYNLPDLIADIPTSGWITNNDFHESRMSEGTLLRIEGNGTRHIINPLDNPKGSFNYTRIKSEVETATKRQEKPILKSLHAEISNICQVTVIDRDNKEVTVAFVLKKPKIVRPAVVKEKVIRQEDFQVQVLLRIWAKDLFKNTADKPTDVHHITLGFLANSVPKEGWTKNKNKDDKVIDDYSNTDSDGNKHTLVVKKDGTLSYITTITKEYLANHSNPGDIILSKLETTNDRCNALVQYSGKPMEILYRPKF